MTPPPTAAIALLGVWILVIFWATMATGSAQARADDRLDPVVPDDRLDELEDSSDNTATSFVPADD